MGITNEKQKRHTTACDTSLRSRDEKRDRERSRIQIHKTNRISSGANNELMKELEHWENEIITVSKESAVDIEEGGDELLHEEGGGVHDGDGLSGMTQDNENTATTR